MCHVISISVFAGYVEPAARLPYSIIQNLLKIKGNSSSFGFVIQELPSEEAI